MARSSAGVAGSVERFFQFALLGLLTSGYLAVAGSGSLDRPTVVLVALGLGLRAFQIAGAIRLEISERWLTAATLAYVGFYPLDYLFLSKDFLQATIHLVFFLAVTKVLTARTNRDCLYIAIMSFLQLLAAAILSVSLTFFFFLAIYLLCAMAAFTSSEIRRAMQKPHALARAGARRLHSRLAVLSIFLSVGILGLTAGLFFMLPRTADAAFERLSSSRLFLPGFSNRVILGQIGQIKTSSRPVMHVRFYGNAVLPADLKWRGAALTDFDGKEWSRPSGQDLPVAVDNGRLELATEQQRASHWEKISYRVELNGLDTDALFFAGQPEVIEIRQRQLLRTPGGSFRLGRVPNNGFHYGAYAAIEAGPDAGTAVALDPPARRRYLHLPKIDSRIPVLARSMAAGQTTPGEEARAIEAHLRRDYGYTLKLPSQEMPDPLAYFLFERKEGHCEYFASAMAVMLRSLGIPARLVTGFQNGTRNPLTDLYVIRASDAHSWVEAWIPNRGWMTFDPTPPDPNAAGASLWTRFAMYLDAGETFWQEWVMSYDLGHQATLADRMGRSGRNFGQRWFDRLVEAGANWDVIFKQTVRFYGWWAAFLLMAGGTGWWVAPRAGRLWRMRLGVRRVRRGQASMADVSLLYARLLEVLRRRGYQKPAWFTPREFAATLPPSEMADLTHQFTAIYNAVRFGKRLDAAPELSILLDRLERQESR